MYAVKKIVTDVTDAGTQMSLTEAKQRYGDEADVDMEVEFSRPPQDPAPTAAPTVISKRKRRMPDLGWLVGAGIVACAGYGYGSGVDSAVVAVLAYALGWRMESAESGKPQRVAEREPIGIA